MQDTIIFPIGIIARDNRTNNKFELKEAVKGYRENNKVYRLVNSHWVYVIDNPTFNF
jgi:hypothetical protein